MVFVVGRRHRGGLRGDVEDRGRSSSRNRNFHAFFHDKNSWKILLYLGNTLTRLLNLTKLALWSSVLCSVAGVACSFMPRRSLFVESFT